MGTDMGTITTRKSENGKRKTESGERKTESEERKAENGKRKTGEVYFLYSLDIVEILLILKAKLLL